MPDVDQLRIEIQNGTVTVVHVTVDERGKNTIQSSGRFAVAPAVKGLIEYLVDRLYRNDLDEPGMKVLGEAMFDLLLPDRLGEIVKTALYTATNAKRNLHLWISQDPESSARQWPVEFLRAESTYLGTDADIALSRNIRLDESRFFTNRHSSPLKVLVVVSRPEKLGGVLTIAVEHIAKWALNQAPGKIEVQILGLLDDYEVCEGAQYLSRAATISNLTDGIREFCPDIIHFIGHGRVLHQTAEIALVDDFGEVEWCPGDDLRSTIRTASPALVVLQACDSALPDSARGFMSLAEKLVQAHVPAVVAMQFEVRNDYASLFTSSFYEALAAGLPIDSAVQKGRSKITTSGIRWKERHFGAPVLYLVSPGEAIISPSTSSAPPMLNSSLDVAPEALSEIRRFPDSQARAAAQLFKALGGRDTLGGLLIETLSELARERDSRNDH